MKALAVVLVTALAIVLAVVLSFALGVFGQAVNAKYAKAVVGYKVTQAVYSAQNRIQAQQWFETTYNEIQGFGQQINVLTAAYKASPSPYNQTNLTGAKLACIQAVNDYNAATQKILDATWLPSGLPYHIDDAQACA